nr:M7 protein transcript variant 2 [Fagopyrum tataricum]
MTSQNMKTFNGKVTPLLVATLILTALVIQGVEAHNCGSTFFSALVQLIPCRASVAPFSPIPPSDACCNAIKVLGQSCLCILVNGPPISGVDRSMAMQLPDKCSTDFEPCELVRK